MDWDSDVGQKQRTVTDLKFNTFYKETPHKRNMI